MKQVLLLNTTLALLQADIGAIALQVLTGKSQKAANQATLKTCACVNWKGSTTDKQGKVGTDQTWYTPQGDDTEYGKLYASGKAPYLTGAEGGEENYGEYCAAWEDSQTAIDGGKKGVVGQNTDCADVDTRPDWCSKKWCYVRLDGEANGSIMREPLDKNAPGKPDGPGCTELSDVTVSKQQDSFLWYSYQICENAQ